MTDSNGLYYMRARYYSPELMRFINQDVLQGNLSDGRTLNHYAYANRNPVSNIDSFGLSAESDNPNSIIHTILDALGLVPGFGNIVDGVNTILYLAEGDYLNAGLSALSLIPFEGIFATFGKWGARGVDTVTSNSFLRDEIIDGADNFGDIIKNGGRKASDNLPVLYDPKFAESQQNPASYFDPKRLTETAGSVKRGPKPFGAGSHNLKINDVVDSVTDGEIIAGGQRLPEISIKTPGGIKSSRHPDILVERPDGSVYGINVEKTTSSGAPIKREIEAIYDLEDAGIEMHFVPYDK